MASPQDIQFMKHALSIARRGLGNVWPNPAVGCVIVRDGVLVGRGWTQPGGWPHAEPVALAQAGELARGADVYVTLEPCSHYGQTPPCAQALIEAGVARVVVACGDPDSRVSGRGIKMLRDAGIDVVEGVLETEARALNAGFLSRIERGRPFVTLKVASTLDGKIALGNRESQWITSELARRHAHLERSKHDAILVGIGTAFYDDPSLTTRLPGYDHSVVRVALDRSARLPDSAKMAQGLEHDPLWVICEKGNDTSSLEAYGAVAISLDDLSVEAILHALFERGITRLLVEGGAKVYRSFLLSGLVDEIHWYRAPCVIGEDGFDAVPDLGIKVMEALERYKRVENRELGEDVLEIYRVKA